MTAMTAMTDTLDHTLAPAPFDADAAGWGFPSLLAQASAPPPTSGDAQPTTPAQGAPGSGQGQPPPPTGFGNSFFIIILLLMLALFLPTIFAGRKEKKRRAQMLASIAKHDRVQTVGGVLGTITEVRDNEVVLKVDDATNTRIRFARSAIQQVLRKSGERSNEGAGDDPPSEPAEPALQTAAAR